MGIRARTVRFHDAVLGKAQPEPPKLWGGRGPSVDLESTMRRMTFVAGLGLVLIAVAAPLGAASRIKDIAAFEGVRDNQLVGYGLVVGLNGTGDRSQTFFSTRTLTNLLERSGLTVSPTQVRVKNIAAVMVTAILPPFVRQGG